MVSKVFSVTTSSTRSKGGAGVPKMGSAGMPCLGGTGAPAFGGAGAPAYLAKGASAPFFIKILSMFYSIFWQI